MVNTRLRTLDLDGEISVDALEEAEYLRQYEESYSDSYPAGSSSLALKVSSYRHLVFLQPASYYFALAEPDRRGGRTNRLMRMTLLDSNGSYFWQLVGIVPPPGLWFFRTHEILTSQVGQIRFCSSIDYHAEGLTKPQVKNDIRVLRAIAQHALKPNERLKRNAGISDLRTLKASIHRLCEQGILDIAPDGLCGFRLPSDSEMASWRRRNPYQRTKSVAVAKVTLTDAQLSERIIKIIRAEFRGTKGGTSQRDLRSQLPCRPMRIQRAVEDLVLAGQITDISHKKKRYFPAGC